MTPEEKLNHLPDWIECIVDCRISRRRSMDVFWYCFNELGILISPSIVENPIPNFKQYLQYIEHGTNKLGQLQMQGISNQ
jgi:hypothetical protein